MSDRILARWRSPRSVNRSLGLLAALLTCGAIVAAVAAASSGSSRVRPASEIVAAVRPTPVPSCPNTADVWQGGSPGAWETPGNWSAGSPGSSSYVCIPNGATVDLNSTDTIAGLLLESGATLDVQSDGLTVSGISAPDSALQGSLQVAASASFTVGSAGTMLNATGGSITSLGTVQVSGTFEQDAGTVTAGGDKPVQLANGSSLVFAGTGLGAFQVSDANATTIDVALSGNISAGQSLEIQSPQGGNNDPLTTVTAAGSFTNAGTITFDYAASAGGYEDSSELALPSGDTLTNAGTIQTVGSPDGSYPGEWNETIDGNVDNQGTINVGESGDPYSVLVLAPGSTLTNDGGTVNVLSAANANANNSGPSELFVSAATTGGNAEPAASLINSSGTIYNQGTVQVQGAFSQGAGTVSTAAGDNPIEFNNGSSIAFTGSGPGTFQVTDASASAIGVALSGNIAAGQSLEIQAPQYSFGDKLTTVTAAGSFTNAGSITLDYAASAGGYEDSTELALPSGDTLTNTGTIKVAGSPDGAYVGEWNDTIDGNLANYGIIDVGLNGEPYAVLVLAAGSTLTNDGGTVNVLSAANANANNSGPSDLFISAATTGGSAEPAAKLVNSSGTINDQGTVQVQGAFSQGAGTVSTAGGDNPIELNNGSSIAFTGSGPGAFQVTDAAANTIAVALSGNISAGQSLEIQSPQGGNNDPLTTVTAAGSFTNAGTITLDHAGGEDSVELAIPSADTLTNTGTIRAGGSPDTSYSSQWNETLDANVANDGILDVGITGQPGAYLVIPNGVTVTNNGTINVLGASSSSNNDASKLGADNGLLQSAGTTNLAAGTLLDVSQSASGLSLSGGALAGAGQVAGSVDQTGGTITPGITGTPGTLTITGSYTEASGATVAVPINGTTSGQYSVLAVGGNANLAGGLTLEPSSSYQSSAQLGDSDPVFTYAGTLTGSFASAAVAPQDTVLPQVTGSTSVGDTLQCVTGTFTDSPTDLTYQWDRNGTAIPTATSSTYELQSVDLGTTISCSQTAGGGSALSGGRGFNAGYSTPNVIDAVVGSTYASGSTTAFSAGILIPEPTTNVAAVTIPTATLPAASDHGAYGTALTACGGTAPSCEVYSPSAGTLVDSLDNPVSTGDQFMFAKTSGSLPPGITLSSQGYLFGTPTQPGSYQFTVVATDPDQNASSPYAYTLTVNPAAAVTISPTTLPAAVGANAYSASLTACGGTAPSCETYSSSAGTLVNASGSPVSGAQQFTFTTVSGSLPPGITLSSQGYVSGTPTQSGSYHFTVVATDPNQDASNAYSYTLSVNPGIAITAGSFHLAGSLPAGAAAVTAGSSGGIDAVSITGSSASSLATITGAGVPANVNQIGLQIGHDQSGDCLTELELEGPGGVVFNAANLDISGCDSAAAAATTALLSSAAVRGRSARTRQALASAATLAGRVRTTVRVPASSVSSVIAPASPVLTTAAAASDCSYASELANVTVANNGTCTATGSGSFVIHISGTSPISGSVAGGTYTAELNGSQQSSSVQMTPVMAAAPSFPPILTVTPITRLVDSQAGPVGSSTSSASQSLMASYGFPSGTTAEQVLPSFAASTGASAQDLSALAALESEAASLNSSNRGSLVSALASELADGVFDSSLPSFDDPLGSGTLQAAGTSQFASGVSSFSSSYGTTIPSLAPAGSTIKAALPVSPIAPVTVPIVVAPSPVGSITKIGAGAFSVTVTVASPTVRTAPFTAGPTSFTIEVVS